MTSIVKFDKKSSQPVKRTWMEKNGPTIYGASVFAALAVLVVVHLLISG